MKSKPLNDESVDIRRKLGILVDGYSAFLSSDDLRKRVQGLIPVFKQLRRLGKSLIRTDGSLSARDRILFYFKKYSRTSISGDEFLVVSGIQDYPRRVRELRVQFGWRIISGYAARDMAGVMDVKDSNRMVLAAMKPSDYILTSDECDREAAHRWHTAHSIREKDASVRDKILEYLRENVGRSVTGEELRYVANNRTEWARRVRELRTEFGWPIVTQNTGREDLDVGAYILEADRQSPVHDRKIPDDVRFAVLERDKYKCRKCGWSQDKYNRSNPRHLELHHVEHHAKGGENKEKNLITLCTSCHDSVHKSVK